MAIKTETIRELQVLSQGRNPQDQNGAYILAPNGTPSTDSDGFDVSGLSPRPVLAFVGVTIQAVPERVDSTVTVDTVVVGDTYRVTFDGTDYDYVALLADTAADVVVGLIASIGAATILKASPSDNGNGSFEFVGVKTATYTLAVSVPAGTGTMSATQDASTVDYRVWFYAPGKGWHTIPDTARTGITLNEAERFTVSGVQRLYVEIQSTDGRVKALFQPALLE